MEIAPARTTKHLPWAPFVAIAPAPCGKYTLVAKLGHGGMAEVFLAVANGLAGFRKLLVVKRIHAQLLDEPDFLAMFLDEARLAARLSHPNVVHTMEIGTASGLPYIAMEHLDGQCLDRILRYASRNDVRLPPAIVARIVADTLAGLEYAHALRDFDVTSFGVVHRDISPSNICVTYQGVVKILDFGIAKAKAGMRMTQTRVGLVKGNFSYMAPEQARGFDVDARADLWSMGVVLWELATQQRLFRGENPIKRLEGVLRGDIPELTQPVDGVPEELLDVARRALARDPDERWASAGEMRAALERYIACEDAPMTSADLGRFVSSMFEEVIAAQQNVLRKLPQFASVAAAAEAEQERRAAHGGAELVTRSGTRLRRFEQARPAGSRSRSWTLVAASILGLAVIAAAWLGRASSSIGVAEASFERGPATLPRVASAQAAAPAAAPAPAGIGPRRVSHRTATHHRARHHRGPRAKARAARAASRPDVAVTQPPRETGVLTLDTHPWSEVFLDGRSLGTTPLIRARVPAGSHVLTLRNSERGIATQVPVTIAPGGAVTRRLGLE